MQDLMKRGERRTALALNIFNFVLCLDSSLECEQRGGCILPPLSAITLSLWRVHATNSGIAPHAALPCPLAPPKHKHHVWMRNGL